MTDTPTPNVKNMDDIVALCRRRGFIWQSSEIYGGINGFWDYGPLGVELKRNLKDAWWNDIVKCPPDGPDGHPIDTVGLDCTIIMHPKVWEASGHLAGFNDPMVDCKHCKQRFRADHIHSLLFTVPNTTTHEVVHQSNIKSIVHGHAHQMRTILNDLARPYTGPNVQPNEETEWRRYKSQELEAHIAALKNDLAPKVLFKTVVASSVEEAKALLKLKSKEAASYPCGPYTEDLITNPTTNQSGGFHTWGPPSDWYVPIDRLRPCPNCGECALTEPRQFNLMFPSYAGAVFDEANKVYLRPETAQGIFTQFWNVVDTSRVKVPFGIAQIGKAFRNEVTPRNFTFRSREFEQMEIEFFIHPSTANEWYAWWRDFRFAWWQSIGLTSGNLQLREHDKDELAHYAKTGAGTSDIEYKFPFTAPGFGELEGVAHRADFDLRAHANACGKGDKLQYFDQAKNERYFPHVIEPSAGADRGTLALLCEAYTPDTSRASGVYMNFTPRMAPIKAAIFPLVNKDGMPEVADALYRQVRKRWNIQCDAKQSIGKRYARMDEAGTPFCFTIDTQTLTDQTVTVRERNTQSQERIALDKVEAYLAEKIG